MDKVQTLPSRIVDWGPLRCVCLTGATSKHFQKDKKYHRDTHHTHTLLLRCFYTSDRFEQYGRRDALGATGNRHLPSWPDPLMKSGPSIGFTG